MDKLRKLLGIIVLVALLFSGCGGDNKTENQNFDSAPESESTVESGAESID